MQMSWGCNRATLPGRDPYLVEYRVGRREELVALVPKLDQKKPLRIGHRGPRVHQAVVVRGRAVICQRSVTRGSPLKAPATRTA
jgi:hypothetical protein